MLAHSPLALVSGTDSAGATACEKPSDAVGSGSGIVLWAETYEGCILGGGALGSKGMDAARVGREAARELTSNLDHGGCVDEYMQDQLIIFSALAKGKSIIMTGPISLHTRCVHFLIMYQMSTMEIDNATSI